MRREAPVICDDEQRQRHHTFLAKDDRPLTMHERHRAEDIRRDGVRLLIPPYRPCPRRFARVRLVEATV